MSDPATRKIRHGAIVHALQPNVSYDPTTGFARSLQLTTCGSAVVRHKGVLGIVVNEESGQATTEGVSMVLDDDPISCLECIAGP